MANGLPDQESQNEEQQTNELDQLNNTMSSVRDVLVAQLESLKSIARWQDQTALYTSHLQNIKTDMNQVRKWGSHIEQIAQRVDVIATRLSSDATPQSGDDKPSEDATTLLPTLGMIEANTRLTYESIQVLADATRESQEDKRVVQQEAVSEKKPVKDKKAETGVRKHMGDAMTGVRDFFSKIMSWFAMATLFIAPLMIGPDKLFGALKEFFGHLKTFFTAIAKFFMENVVPAISFLMEKLISFFNEISGPLGRLGTEIGHALKLIGPKLWNAVSPVLDAVGVGLVKAIDFFTVVVGKIGPALDVIGQFVSDIFAKFGGANEMVGDTFESIGDFFENILMKMKATNVDDMMDNLRIALQTMFNATMDALYGVATSMIQMYVDFTSPGNTTLLDELTATYAAPLQAAKFTIDRSGQRSSLIDFNQSDANVNKQIAHHLASKNIEQHEADIMMENKEHFKARQAERADHSLKRISAIETTSAVADPGVRIDLYKITGVRGAIPNFEHDEIVVRGTGEGNTIESHGYYHGEGAEDRATNLLPYDITLEDPIKMGQLENLLKRSRTAKGASVIGQERPDLKPSEIIDMSLIELQNTMGQEVSSLSTATPPPASSGGNQNNVLSNVKGNTTLSSFSIHKSGDPTVPFGRDYKDSA